MDAEAAWESWDNEPSPPVTPLSKIAQKPSPKSSTPQPKKADSKEASETYPTPEQSKRLQAWWCKYKKPKATSVPCLDCPLRAQSWATLHESNDLLSGGSPGQCDKHRHCRHGHQGCWRPVVSYTRYLIIDPKPSALILV